METVIFACIYMTLQTLKLQYVTFFLIETCLKTRFTVNLLKALLTPPEVTDNCLSVKSPQSLLTNWSFLTIPA